MGSRAGGAGSVCARCSSVGNPRSLIFRAASAGYKMPTGTALGGLTWWSTAIRRLSGVSKPCEGREREAGRWEEKETSKKMIPGAALRIVPGTSKGKQRTKSAAAMSGPKSIYAEELARCDTSTEVLRLLYTCSARGEESSKRQLHSQHRQDYERPSSRDNVAPPYLLPVDCLAFLNALQRVQHLRSSASDFVYFCRALEDTLQRHNASLTQSFPPDAPDRSAGGGLSINIQEDGLSSKSIYGESLYAALEPRTSRARPLRCTPPPYAGRFVRLVLQKLAELRAPLAFNQMVFYLAPHVPSLRPVDVAECLWSFAVMQPPDWRARHTPLLNGLLRRLLDLHPEAFKAQTHGTGGARRAGDAESGRSGCREEDAARPESEMDSTGRTSPEAAAPTQTLVLKRFTPGSVHEAPKTVRLKQRLKWVGEGSEEEGWQSRGTAEDTDGAQFLVVDDLSNLLMYRVVFGVAKLDFRCPVAQDVYQAVAPRIVRRLADQGVEAFPPGLLVRIAWAYARLRVRHVPLYKSVCKMLGEVLEDLSLEELEVVQHVYETLQIYDKDFLDAVDLLLRQMRELNEAGVAIGDRPYQPPRIKHFKTKRKRVTVTDPVL